MAVGMDISPRYQDGFNWSIVDNSDDPNRGVRFAWVKASDGSKPYFWTAGTRRLIPDTPVAGAKSRGIPVGVYHYAQPVSKGGSPESQAQVMLGEMRRLGATGVAPLLDIEEPGTVNADFGKRFCGTVAAAGYRPAVYMNASDAKAIHPDQWGIPNLLIVIARYGAKPESAGGSQYLGRYDVHQYSSGGSRGGETVDLDDSKPNTDLSAVTAPIITGGFVAGFNAADFNNLMWGNVFDTNGNRNFAKFVKDLDAICRDTNADTNAIVEAFNQLGAELSLVFTQIDSKLDAILAAVNAPSSAAVAVDSERLATLDVAATPRTKSYADHAIPQLQLDAAAAVTETETAE